MSTETDAKKYKYSNSPRQTDPRGSSPGKIQRNPYAQYGTKGNRKSKPRGNK